MVLKPVEFLAESVWQADVLAGLPESAEFRVARRVPTRDGASTKQGWECSRLVTGHADVRRPDEVLRAGAAFHAAVAHLPRPSFVDAREDPWAVGDRVAWREQDVGTSPTAKALMAPLVEAWRQVDLDHQVVHGDLTGNVLFVDGRPPAIIDWPVYWRPTSWAAAVVVADVLCWHDPAPDLATRWAHLPEWGQMLVRALIFRIVTHDLNLEWTDDELAHHRPVIDLAVRYASGGTT